MINKKIKRALADMFDAPPPVNKTSFLKQHRRRELGRWELVRLQAKYIRWWVWVLSLVLSAFIFATNVWAVEPAPWYVAALTPFLALLVITENGRAQLHQMEELELACRISRQSVILARMVVLGLFHMALFGLLTLPLTIGGAVGIAQAGIYLLTPYLLTTALGMDLTRRIRGWEGLLACGATTAAISILGPFAAKIRPALYQPENLIWWGATLAAAIIATTAEFSLNIKNMRELQWT
ncbi:hypothetical protein N510_001932 [Firmicutes bacterium ASF500]|nr:hypothetical protein N510_001932 [Firmicutes bacterium ASF500]